MLLVELYVLENIAAVLFCISKIDVTYIFLDRLLH